MAIKAQTAYRGPITAPEYVKYLEKLQDKFPADKGKLSNARLFNAKHGQVKDAHILALRVKIERKTKNNNKMDAIFKPATGKAYGIDGTGDGPIRVIHMIYPEFWIQYMTCFACAMIVAQTWKCDIKAPFAKPGKKGDEHGHLRPITLMSLIAKQFEAMISELNDTEDDIEQGAFQKKLCTDGRVFILYSVIIWITRYMDVGVWIGFIDLSSYFDTIREPHLIQHLIEEGENPAVCELISQISSGNFATVKMKNSGSELTAMPDGARQGGRYSVKSARLMISKWYNMIKDKIKGIPCVRLGIKTSRCFSLQMIH
jgi:hypothetical protein